MMKEIVKQPQRMATKTTANNESAVALSNISSSYLACLQLHIFLLEFRNMLLGRSKNRNISIGNVYVPAVYWIAFYPKYGTCHV